MKKILSAAIFVTVVSLILFQSTFAQTNSLTLRLSRDFGYGGFNGDIQGLFTMKVTGPSDLVRVVFYIDSTTIGEVNNSPFSLQFNTDNYSIGEHKISAMGVSSSGQQYQSNIISSTFVPASEGNKVVLRIVIPLMIIIFGAIILSFIVPLIFSRGKSDKLPYGVERKYGLNGGGICPKCRRPFVLPLFSMHFGFSKLARCPYCGKWGMVKVETIGNLRKAEREELEWGRVDDGHEDEKEKAHKELDDSKFQDL